MAGSDNPLESFRQVLTGASRAIAREPERELGFTAQAPSASGKVVKMPMPTRSPLVPSAIRLLLMCVTLHGAAASAQQPRAPTIYSTEPIGQVLLPLPHDGGEQTVENGDIVLRGRIAYRAFATMPDPIEIVMVDGPVRVMAGEMLAERRVRGPPTPFLVGARAFCLPSRRPSNGVPSPWRLSKEACFVDRDNDGRFDFALLTGKNVQKPRVTVPLNAVPYSVQPDVPFPEAEFRIVYQGKPALGATFLAIVVSLPGFSFEHLDRIRWRGPDGRMRGVPYDRPVKNSTYPHIVSFGSARIEILAYDSEAKRVRLRVLQGFARTDMEIVLAVSGR